MPTWNNPGPQEFDATLESAGSGGGCAVIVPLDVPALYGVKGRVPILAHINGVEYRGSMTPYGGSHWLGVFKSIREQLGKESPKGAASDDCRAPVALAAGAYDARRSDSAPRSTTSPVLSASLSSREAPVTRGTPPSDN